MLADITCQWYPNSDRTVVLLWML